MEKLDTAKVLRELETQLIFSKIRAEYSQRMEWIVWEKLLPSQKEITNRWFERVSKIRRRIEEIKSNK